MRERAIGTLDISTSDPKLSDCRRAISLPLGFVRSRWVALALLSVAVATGCDGGAPMPDASTSRDFRPTVCDDPMGNSHAPTGRTDAVRDRRRFRCTHPQGAGTLGGQHLGACSGAAAESNQGPQDGPSATINDLFLRNVSPSSIRYAPTEPARAGASARGYGLHAGQSATLAVHRATLDRGQFGLVAIGGQLTVDESVVARQQTLGATSSSLGTRAPALRTLHAVSLGRNEIVSFPDLEEVVIPVPTL